MRLFLAIELPDPIRRELASLQERLRRAWGGWRWMRPEGIHLTLRFLGEVDPQADADMRGLWERAAGDVAPFDLRLGATGRFPTSGHPRVLWVGAEEIGGGGRLIHLAERVESAARDAGFTPERRPFRPHLTLARARRGSRPVSGQAPAPGPRGEWSVERLILFRSELLPSGARYTALSEFPLNGTREEA